MIIVPCRLLSRKETSKWADRNSWIRFPAMDPFTFPSLQLLTDRSICKALKACINCTQIVQVLGVEAWRHVFTLILLRMFFFWTALKCRFLIGMAKPWRRMAGDYRRKSTGAAKCCWLLRKKHLTFVVAIVPNHTIATVEFMNFCCRKCKTELS